VSLKYILADHASDEGVVGVGDGVVAVAEVLVVGAGVGAASVRTRSCGVAEQAGSPMANAVSTVTANLRRTW
jgi:hypothetical protein